MMLDTTAGLDAVADFVQHDAVADFTQHVANGGIPGEARKLWYAAILEPAGQGLTAEGERK
eukprot:3606432-Lingulodinium_polyedra.AAC.1